VATERTLARTKAANCCMTAGTSTYTTTGELAVTDAQADDPCPGAGYIDVRDLSQQRRNLFRLQDVVAYAEVIRKCIEVLETEGDADVSALQAWLAAQQPRFTLDRAFLSVRRDGDVLWVDWMLIFCNGAVGMAQVAKGGVKPVYSMARPGKGASPLTRANIDTTPTETNVEGIDIAFPRLSLLEYRPHLPRRQPHGKGDLLMVSVQIVLLGGFVDGEQAIFTLWRHAAGSSW
jgi:hypothetical protein